MIGKTISHYKIIEKIGEGGMGVVYRALDTKLDRLVALKFLPPHLKKNENDKARFYQEAKAAAALNHPNVCTIHEIHDEGENPFIVMEYIEGKTLHNIIEEHREAPMPLSDVIDIAVQIAEALKSAHSKGIVHRDIKSENIMVTETGQVKVMDFGLARLRGVTKLAETSSTVGTLAYMSPEQIQGQEVDARSDIFSFGVVLYEMLTGHLPFGGEYESALMYSILNEEPEPVQKYRSDISSELLHIINRALEKVPGERYQSIDDMLIDLKRLKRDMGKGSSDSPGKMPAIEKPGAAKKPRSRLWIGVTAAVVLVIVGLWFIGQQLFQKGPEVKPIRRNSIAVMYFEDHSGEDNFGKILAEMLTSNLSRCKQIDVVSSQHLFDILKKIGKEDVEAIDRSIATEVATNARVQTMLLGSIYRIGNSLNVNAQLCDVRTGSVIGAAQTRGSRVEDVYEMVNKLTEDVIQLMGVSLPENGKPLRINDVTTRSFDAYKHYQRAKEHIRRWNWQDAREELQEAIRIDSTFAMAHCLLAEISAAFSVLNPLSDLSEERKHIYLANKYSQIATEKERDMISLYMAIVNRDFQTFLTSAKAFVEHYPDDKRIYGLLGIAYYIAGNYKQAAEYFKKGLEISPQDANTYNGLSFVYSKMGEHEKAISMVRQYIALQPDVSNTYDSAFEVYLMAGQYDEAYRVCEDALKINPGWTRFVRYESYIHLFRGEGDKARKRVHQLARMYPSLEMDLASDLGCFNMYEGRYKEATPYFEKVVALAHEAKDTTREIHALLYLGKFYNVRGEFSKAAEEFARVKELSRKVYGTSYNAWPILADYYYGVTAIHQGHYSEAIKIAENIKDYIVSNSYNDILMDYHYLLLAEVYTGKAQPAKAEGTMRKVSGITRSNFPRCRKLKAELLALQGKPEKAIDAYMNFYNDWETKSEDFGGDFFDYFRERSLVYYRVAQLYEEMGDRNQAVHYYKKALDQWENADKDMPELVDVKMRLKKLGQRI